MTKISEKQEQEGPTLLMKSSSLMLCFQVKCLHHSRIEFRPGALVEKTLVLEQITLMRQSNFDEFQSGIIII